MKEKEQESIDPPGQNKEVTITVNGRDFPWTEKRISFAQVLGLIGVSETSTVYYIISYSKVPLLSELIKAGA